MIITDLFRRETLSDSVALALPSLVVNTKAVTPDVISSYEGFQQTPLKVSLRFSSPAQLVHGKTSLYVHHFEFHTSDMHAGVFLRTYTRRFSSTPFPALPRNVLSHQTSSRLACRFAQSSPQSLSPSIVQPPHRALSSSSGFPPQPNARRAPPRSSQRDAEIHARNKNLAAWALAVVLATVGMSYASVPLYRIFCQVTGFGGTVRTTTTPGVQRDSPAASVRRDADADDGGADGGNEGDRNGRYASILAQELEIDETKIVKDRPITIRFNADVSARVPWKFTPLQSEVVVLPGETALAFYLAENKSKQPITGIATYNITPAKAAIYFNKVQCFCFDEQRLKPGEELDMPVFFFIDPEFATDVNMADISDIVLSYTFFKAEDVTPEQLLKAQALAMGH